MRIAHLTDIHARPDRAAEVFAGFDTVEAEHARRPFDLFAISGDFWDASILNVERSMFLDFVDRIRRLADLAPVAMIYGTPTHDAPGSLDIFETVRSQYDISVLQPGVAYFLEGGGISTGPEGAHALILGVPEPNKKWLLAESGATGKEAADKAVRDRLRALFLGLGGLRKQHSDLPCVLLYHGEIAGSKTSTGYRPEAGTGLTVTVDDLAAVGADYYALGHIHAPQGFGGIVGGYGGSLYSEWGEYHKPGFNAVEISATGDQGKGADPLFRVDSAFEARISRVDFPMPQKVKIHRKPGDGRVYRDMDINGRMVWEEWTVSKDEANEFDAEAELGGLLNMGAMPGSRVTINILPSETVRAGDIAAKKDIVEKLKVWGENSSTEISAELIAKTRALEEQCAVGVQGQGGHTLRIDYLRLRGAKGIWKNQKKDEVYLDLAAYGPGVITLIGPNGMGKTTIIENMHPYPQLLTRDGTLKSHFRLRDSCRELGFTDLSTGWKYRTTIEINAATASGAAEYWLHIDKGTGYEPAPGVTGRLADYEAAIAEIFGSLEMYLRTAFVTQTPTTTAPDLAKATKGQRKQLFAELSGIDYLDRYKEAARAEGDALESEIARLDAKIDAAETIVYSLDMKKEELAAAEKVVDTASTELKNLEVQGFAARKAVDEAVDAEKKALEAEGAARRAAQGIADAQEAIKATREEIEGYREATEKRPAAEKAVQAYEAQTKARDALLTEKAGVDQKNHEALQDYQTVARAARAKQDQARRELDEGRRTLSTLERTAAVALAAVPAEIEMHCPTCGQLLPEETRQALIDGKEQAKAKAQEASNAVQAQTLVVNALADALRAIAMPAEPVPWAFARQAELDDILTDLSFIEPEARRAREIIAAAGEAAIRSEEAERRIADKTTIIQALTPQAAALEALTRSHSDVASVLAQRKEDLERISTEYRDTKARGASAEATVRMLHVAIDEALATLKAAEAAKTERDAMAKDLADWRTLERAYGPDGIQALELDALAPSIAAMTNNLLASSYGERYTVHFDTTRIGGKGAKAKQIEDFLIFIQDAETGEEQEIGTLSGGEAVWFRKALYDAFAIIRGQNTGIRFATAFLDEADGALDPASRQRYLTMLETAHRESHRHQTLIITHSAELQAMIGQTINVAELKARETL